jgi:hypothetical protein
MKLFLLIPLAVVALFSNSCRTVVPVDPMTGKQSCRCMPINVHPETLDCSGQVVTSSK